MLITDISAKIELHEAEIRSSVERVISSGWFVLGPEVSRFEAAFSAYLQAHHCVTVANGTDAIELGLKAVGIKKGDRVATVANAGMYTTMAILAIGAFPLYLDVDRETRNVTCDEVKRGIGQGANAVVVTHLYGLAVSEIAKISQLCMSNNVALLEDCAQAHGARVSGRCVGTFGDVSSFSFYPTKNLGTLGDGGAVVTNSSEISERTIRLRQYGWKEKYKTEISGGRNSRLDEIQAAVLQVLLPHLDKKNIRRREIASYYNEMIHNKFVDLPIQRGDEYVGHLYVVRSALRDSLRAHLKSLNINSDIHYPIPDYRQPIFGKQYVDVYLPNTETLAKEVLTLPCYPEMTEEQTNKVVAGVNTWQP